jgi:2-iminobutanoate/2-iminopropanoate deaminase
MAQQTRRALASLEGVLLGAGSNVLHVLKVNLYVADIEQWDIVNAEYADFFRSHRPARAVIPTGPLHFGALIEIDAIASLPHFQRLRT